MSHQGYQPLSTKDVVFVEGIEQSAALFKSDATLRVKDLLSKLEAICTASGQLSAAEVTMLFGHGISCELLRPGATDWEQGCLQFTLGFQSGGISAPKTATIEYPIPAPAAEAKPKAPIAAPKPIPAPEAVKAPEPKIPEPMTSGRSETIAATAPKAATNATAIPLPAPQNAVVASPSNTSSVVLDRSSVTALVDDTPELDLASFANVTAPGQSIEDELDLDNIDHSDVFSLMEAAADVTPLDDDFTFPEGLEGIEELNFDEAPVPKSISSPWDLEELDGMLMVK
jgi:hypothetical protein